MPSSSRCSVKRSEVYWLPASLCTAAGRTQRRCIGGRVPTTRWAGVRTRSVRLSLPACRPTNALGEEVDDEGDVDQTGPGPAIVKSAT